MDFPAVSQSGRTFAMIRVGYGIQRTWGFEGYVSKSFVPQLVQAQAAGLDTGVYWYSHALNTDQARIEARTCLDAIKPYRLTFLPAYCATQWSYSANSLSYTLVSNQSFEAYIIG